MSTLLKTSALAAALLAAGAAYAAPFNDLFDPPGTTAPATASSPPPFNFLNSNAVATDEGAIAPEHMERRHARRHRGMGHHMAPPENR